MKKKLLVILAVTPDMYSDRHVYFDGGEELYQALLHFTEK